MSCCLHTSYLNLLHENLIFLWWNLINATEEKSYMPGGLWRGKHSSHLRVNIKKKKDKNQQMQLKKMMLQMLQQPKLNPLRKQNSSSRGWKSIHGWFTRKMAITAVHVLSSLHGDLGKYNRMSKEAQCQNFQSTTLVGTWKSKDGIMRQHEHWTWTF